MFLHVELSEQNKGLRFSVVVDDFSRFVWEVAFITGLTYKSLKE